MANLNRRIEKLEKLTGSCADAVVTLLTQIDGEQPPPISRDAPRCPGCGQVHVLRLRIRKVTEA